MKELETSIRSQVAAEERAHKIVQRLVLEDEISRDILITSVSLVDFQGTVGRIRGGGKFAFREGMKYLTSSLKRIKWHNPEALFFELGIAHIQLTHSPPPSSESTTESNY